MYKIDCHSHMFDPFIIEGISKLLSKHNIKEEKTYATRSQRDFLTPEERLRVMDSHGVDVAAIEYHIVYQHYDETQHSPSVRVQISQLINDRLSEVAQKYPDRYFMMADIPLVEVDAGIRELLRCSELGTKGLCLGTHINGKPLTSPEFRPFWEEVDRLGMPVLLHPRSDLKPERISEYAYHAMVGYPFDTTVAGIDLLMDNFMDKHSRINLMLCHCGGALPFIKKRLDLPAEHYDGPSMSSMLTSFFYETAMSFPRQLEFTIGEVGLDQLCYGSDYPYYAFDDGIKTIEALSLEEEKKEKIFSGNARRFFGIA